MKKFVNLRKTCFICILLMLILKCLFMEKIDSNIIRLDLTQTDYSDAAVYEENNLIHKEELIDITRIMKRQYQAAIEYGTYYGSKGYLTDIGRKNNAISILGNRGAGKTTFLMTILEQLKKEKLILGDVNNSLLIIPKIDPTLIEYKQHPFVNILASIHAAAEKLLHDQNMDYRNPRSVNHREYEEFQISYDKILKALPSLEGIGKQSMYEDWENSEYIARQGMAKANYAINLERNFHEYTGRLLKLIKRTCIILSFDDSDTNLAKGSEILETLRKYITSPQIIILLTGDIDLYSMLVRQAQWKHFGSDFLGKEAKAANSSNSMGISNMVDQLENQYLMKLLKPGNRILLRTLKEKLLMGKKIEIVLKKDSFLRNEQSSDISQCYRDVLAAVGFRYVEQENVDVRYGKTIEDITSLFLDLPIRTQFALLNAYRDYYLAKDADKEVSNVPGASLKALIRNLTHVFESDLNQRTYLTKYLVTESETYPIYMQSFMFRNHLLGEVTNFLPETHDEVLNRALVTISIFFNYLLRKNKYLVFDYWIRLPYIQHTLKMLSTVDNSHGSVNVNLQEELLNFSVLNADSGLMKGYCQSLAFIRPFLGDKMVGVMPIFSDEVFKDNMTDRLSLAPAVETIDSKGQTHVLLSVFKLIAIIGDVYRMDENTIYKNDKKMLNPRFILDINRLLQFRSYVEYLKDGSENTSEYKIHLINTEPDKGGGDEKNHEFYRKIAEWILEKNDSQSISLHFLYRAFVRFHYGMRYINEGVYTGGKGQLFSAQLLTLLNAVLVEEAIDKGLSEIDLDNHKHIEHVFVRNYKKVKEEYKEKCFCDWLISCPLIYSYLNPVVLKYTKFYKTVSDIDALLDTFQSQMERNRIVFENTVLRKAMAGISKEIEEIKNSRDAKALKEKDRLERELNRIIKEYDMLQYNPVDYKRFYNSPKVDVRSRISDLELQIQNTTNMLHEKIIA